MAMDALISLNLVVECNTLLFPPSLAIQTLNKRRHGLITGPRLKLIIRGFHRFAFSTRKRPIWSIFDIDRGLFPERFERDSFEYRRPKLRVHFPRFHADEFFQTQLAALEFLF